MEQRAARPADLWRVMRLVGHRVPRAVVTYEEAAGAQL